jgi:hypothetical protein
MCLEFDDPRPQLNNSSLIIGHWSRKDQRARDESYPVFCILVLVEAQHIHVVVSPDFAQQEALKAEGVLCYIDVARELRQSQSAAHLAVDI